MKHIILCLFLVFNSLALTFPAAAKEPTLSRNVAREISSAYELMQLNDYAAALVIIDELIETRRDKLKPYDLAFALEFRGNLKFQLNDFDGARADFQAALDLGVLPDKRQEYLRQFIELIDKGEMKPHEIEEKGLFPSKRVAPSFPMKCVKKGGGDVEAHVDLEFDIAVDGTVENLRVVEASDECFIEAARNSVEQWEYDPLLENGEPVRREGEKTRVTFRYEE